MHSFKLCAHLDVFFSSFSILEARRTISYFQFLQGFRKLILTAVIIYHISNCSQYSCTLFYKSRALLRKKNKPTIVGKIALRFSLVFILGHDRIQAFFSVMNYKTFGIHSVVLNIINCKINYVSDTQKYINFSLILASEINNRHHNIYLLIVSFFLYH